MGFEIWGITPKGGGFEFKAQGRGVNMGKQGKLAWQQIKWSK
jgi:hypothetical protein